VDDRQSGPRRRALRAGAEELFNAEDRRRGRVQALRSQLAPQHLLREGAGLIWRLLSVTEQRL
jgi:hypothetical protein